MSVDAVVVDTNVFTSELNPRSPISRMYLKHLIGARVAVAPQTVAEARYGALLAEWGQTRRVKLEMLIRRVHTLPIDDETTWAFARLRTDCHRAGHPLHQKDHIGDLWIAATAIRWGLPLIAHDRIFIDCPGLDIRTELDNY